MVPPLLKLWYKPPMENNTEKPTIRRRADFLDVGVEVIQDGSQCYCKETKATERPWAVISDDLDGTPPEGWFFLRDIFYNRITIRDLVANKIMEISPSLVEINSGRKVRVARIIPE